MSTPHVRSSSYSSSGGKCPLDYGEWTGTRRVGSGGRQGRALVDAPSDAEVLKQSLVSPGVAATLQASQNVLMWRGSRMSRSKQ